MHGPRKERKSSYCRAMSLGSERQGKGHSLPRAQRGQARSCACHVREQHEQRSKKTGAWAYGQSEMSQNAGRLIRALACEHQKRGNQAYALRLLGDIAATRSPGGRATRRPLPTGPVLAEELGMRPLQAHCHRDLGTLSAEDRPTGTGPCRISRSPLSYTRPWT